MKSQCFGQHLALIQARMTTIVSRFYIRDALMSETMGLSVFYYAAAASLDASGRLCAHVSETSRPPPPGGRQMTTHANNFTKKTTPQSTIYLSSASIPQSFTPKRLTAWFCQVNPQTIYFDASVPPALQNGLAQFSSPESMVIKKLEYCSSVSAQADVTSRVFR